MKSSFWRSSLWIACGALVITALAAPKVLPLLHSSESHGAAGSQPLKTGVTPRPPVRVSVMVASPVSLSERVTSTGTLLAEEGIELQAETNGKVVAIEFTEGARVRKGQLLVKLNDADLVAMHSRAKFRKQLAVLRERRLSQLVKQGVARQDEYDAALNESNVQDAELDLTEAQIAKTEIRAPFDGIVGLRYVSEGSFVNASTRIATLQRLDRLKIDFSVPEKYAGRLLLGNRMTFTVVGGDGTFEGRIYAVDPRIDATTRTVLIRALCPNPHGRLLPGAFANVDVTLAELGDALLIPAVAVLPGLNEKNVFIVKAGKAERRAVETGTRTERTVHIIAGLMPGDTVITSGLQQLVPGQDIEIIDEPTT